MALPNPSMSFSPFAILTAEEMNDIVENIESLAAGTGLNDGAVTARTLAQSVGNFGAWQDWTPTYGASGSMTFTSITTAYAKYMQIGKTVHFQMSATGNLGGTASNTITFTLPIPAVYDGNTYTGLVVSPAAETALAYQSSDVSVVSVRRPTGDSYSTGAARQIRVSGSYEVA